MTPRTRLEDLLDERRRQLGLTWRQVATTAGVSHETLRQLRIGEPVSLLTMGGVERAVWWAPRSIQRVLEGGEPEEDEYRSGDVAGSGEGAPCGEPQQADLDLRDGEHLAWWPMADERLMYRLSLDDGSGAMAPAARETPVATVVRELRESVKIGHNVIR